jgi:HSP20 family protein
MVEKTSMTGFWPSLYDPFRWAGARLQDWLAPASDASSDDKAYRITMELPGVAEEDIHLSVDDGVVHLKGEKKSARDEKGTTWHFTERQYGSFSRSFTLPEDADAAGVKAELKDGVLTVTLPKKPPEAVTAAKRVPITRG